MALRGIVLGSGQANQRAEWKDACGRMSGPWRVGRTCDPRTGDAPLIQDIRDIQGHVIAAMGWGPFTDAEINRRARLIAKAPELRDALEAVLAQFGRHPGSTAVEGARRLLDSLEVNE